MASSTHGPAQAKTRCFAALLYSTKEIEVGSYENILEYVMQALVLGESLHAHHPSIRRVLLLHEDLCAHPLRTLVSTRWEVREVGDVEFSGKAMGLIAGGVHERISDRVYIKLRVWDVCSDFEKVCFMDLDMLVRQAMDPVFASRSPFSAVFRGSKELTRPWEDRPAKSYYNARQQFMYGVNGGLFCLWPDGRVYKQMVKEIERMARTRGEEWHHYRKLLSSNAGAEQNYLSYYFAGRTQGIDVRFNFQLHQMALSGALAEQGSSWKRCVEDPTQLCNWHYSAEPKPTRFLTELNGFHDVPVKLLNQESDSIMETHMQRFEAGRGSDGSHSRTIPDWYREQALDCSRLAFQNYAKAWGATWRNMIATWMKALQFYQSWDDSTFTCWACGEKGLSERDMCRHMLCGCSTIQLRMSYYSDTHAYKWYPDMEHWLLTVPLGSNIMKCTQYLSACFNAWQQKYEKTWQMRLDIPHDVRLAPGPTRVNDHFTHVAQMEAECLRFWKQMAKERRGLKRRHDAVVLRAENSGDIDELTSALNMQEWTSGERARKKDSSRSFKEEVEKYQADHILL